MKLTLHRPDTGQDPSGQWWTRDDSAPLGWRAIPEPLWAQNARIARDVSHSMTDPYKRNEADIPLVTVRKTVYMTVQDFEAEALARHGWEIVGGSAIGKSLDCGSRESGSIPEPPSPRIALGKLPRE